MGDLLTWIQSDPLANAITTVTGLITIISGTVLVLVNAGKWCARRYALRRARRPQIVAELFYRKDRDPVLFLRALPAPDATTLFLRHVRLLWPPRARFRLPAPGAEATADAEEVGDLSRLWQPSDSMFIRTHDPKPRTVRVVSGGKRVSSVWIEVQYSKEKRGFARRLFRVPAQRISRR